MSLIKQNNVKRICAQYNYPSEIEGLLEEVCFLVQEKIDGVRSLMMSGSVATGDLVYRRDSASLKIFSDLDLLAFADTPQIAEDFAVHLLEIESRFRTNLFHIDLPVNPMQALRRIAPSYQMAELRKVDSILFGEDFRVFFPSRVDVRFSQQALILNLWKVILYWPDEDLDRQEYFQWALARLILDVPLLVFSELQNVIAGHFARAQAFCELTATVHPLATSAIQTAVMRAANMRCAGTTEGVDLWPDFLAVIDSALCHLHLGGLRDPISVGARARRLDALFPQRSLRRVGGEFCAALREGGSVSQRWAWWLERKEVWAGLSSLEMIAWLAYEDSHSTLNRVEDCLTRFGGRDFRFAGDVRPTKQFRVAYWEGLLRLYPSLCHNSAFVRRAGGDVSD